MGTNNKIRSHVRAHMQNRRYPIWKQLVVFALAGPPIGSLVLLVFITTSEVGVVTLTEAAIQIPMSLSFWLSTILPAAYLVGLVPALVAGFAAALVRARVAGHSWGARVARFIVSILLGAFAGTALPSLILVSELVVSVELATLGAIAALGCTALVEWRASLHPDNSLKPKPLRGSA